MTESEFSCFKCVGDLCQKAVKNLPTCNTTINCYKYAIRRSDATINYNRGCIPTTEVFQDICNVTFLHKDDYSYECCKGDFCNGGHLPILPDINTGRHWYFYYVIVAIICGSFVVLITTLIKIHQYEMRANRTQREGEEGEGRQERRGEGGQEREEELVEMLEMNGLPRGRIGIVRSIGS